MKDVFGHELDWHTTDGAPPMGALCCRGFALTYTFLDYDAAYKAAIAGKSTYTRQDGTEAPIIADVLTVGPALRLVGVVDRNPFAAEGTVERCPPRKIWRCVYNNESNDYRCDIYEKRPSMCVKYPSNTPSGRCEFTTCASTHCPAHSSKQGDDHAV